MTASTIAELQNMFRTQFNKELKIWDGPASFSKTPTIYRHFGEVLFDSLEKNPEEIALIFYDTHEKITRAEVRIQAIRVAQNLSALGYKKGDAITIIVKNSVKLIPILIGALLIGAQINCLKTSMEIHEIEHILKIVRPKIILLEDFVCKPVKIVTTKLLLESDYFAFGPNLSEKVCSAELLFSETGYESEFVAPNLGDPKDTIALLQCSSGTTGLHKVVKIQHACLNISQSFPAKGGIAFSYVDPFWISAWFSYGICFPLKLPLIVTSSELTPDMFFEMLKKYRMSAIGMRGIYANEILRSDKACEADFSCIRWFFTLADCPVRIFNDLKAVLKNGIVGQGYTMTEVAIPLTNGIMYEKPGCVGFLNEGCRVKIYNEDGNLCGINETGELHVTTEFEFKGYLNNEEATKSVIDDEGWFISGDIGYFNDEGGLYIVGRKKEMFTVKGKRIFPEEIEEVLRHHDDIIDVCIVGIADPVIENLLTICVIPRAESSLPEKEVAEIINKRGIDHHKPRGGVHFFESFPMTKSGKVQRYKLTKIVQSRNEKKSSQ